MPADGVITLRSAFAHRETLLRFETAVRANGMHIVGRVDLAAAAAEAGFTLEATTVLMFGNGVDQAALVKAIRVVALDLPFKALIWQGAADQTWLSYRDLRWLAKGHGAARDDARLIIDMAVTIDGIARKATSPP